MRLTVPTRVVVTTRVALAVLPRTCRVDMPRGQAVGDRVQAAGGQAGVFGPPT
jgi:hypothetical protein